ncbi:hypothetical protein [Desulfosarcina ovata]|uniref:Uncharacterized protein n=1 Tax=Desulfosarcina ovata subsp. ovata TaxID=2752305 RepID=A0A5K8ACG2_9BACT|nr:hypothetical protein [Desulfosarcina ovata]BBO90413.1 hypothetical protein DSCOOX_35930 [Desulfosarcina ovata subsp. ovata]
MNKNVISTLVIIVAVIAGVIYCEKKNESNRAEFRNITNSDIGQDFVAFIEQHRENLKELFLSNGYKFDTEWATPKNSVEPDWLGKQVIAIIKKKKVNSISGTVSITGTHRYQGTELVLPALVSFYFRHIDNQWKLAIRDGYFVDPYEEKDSEGLAIPPEIYAGINKIFPVNYAVYY